MSLIKLVAYQTPCGSLVLSVSLFFPELFPTPLHKSFFCCIDPFHIVINKYFIIKPFQYLSYLKVFVFYPWKVGKFEQLHIHTPIKTNESFIHLRTVLLTPIVHDSRFKGHIVILCTLFNFDPGCPLGYILLTGEISPRSLPWLFIWFTVISVVKCNTGLMSLFF